MKILIKQAKILHRNSRFHQEKKDILISGGKLIEISDHISVKADRMVESKNLHCSIGWFDIGTHMGEPGFEFRETADSLSEAAAAGGFTALAPFPNTEPVIQSSADIGYIKKLFAGKIIAVYPIGALSRNTDGKEITEMRDMINHGAIAFSDGLKGIGESGVLLRAMDYLSEINTPIIHFPFDERLVPHGQIHEGKTSVEMGLNGIPHISESILVKRDIELASYTGKNIIIHGLSGASILESVKEARRNHVPISSTVSYLNLISHAGQLLGFQPEYKVLPPIREKQDQMALMKAVQDGTIQAIVSNHVPLEEERKKLEFTYTDFGATGLETCFSALNTFLKAGQLEYFIHALSIGPREILGIQVPAMEEGGIADITLFDISKKWTYTTPRSISANNPFLGKTLKGKVLGIIRGQRHFFNLH